jgi:hypothetical protein
LKEQRAFEKSVVDKIRRGGGESGVGVDRGFRDCRDPRGSRGCDSIVSG